MEQHPVPQNVTTFQFRLIGDMTIKQFGYLAAGAIAAYVFYRLPLPFFFGWPLTVGSALLGFGLAFVPIEERPMDIWILSFFKSIYAPTEYLWQKSQRQPEPITPPLPAVPPQPAPAASAVQNAPRQSATEMLQRIFMPAAKPPQPFPHVQPQSSGSAPSPRMVSQQNADPFGWLKDWFRPRPKVAPTENALPDVFGQPAAPSVTGKRLDVSAPPKVAPLANSAATDEAVRHAKEQSALLEEKLQKLNAELTGKTVTESRILELQKLLTEALSQKNTLEKELVSLRQQFDHQNQQPAAPLRSAGIATPVVTAQPTVRIISPEAAVKAGLPKLTTFPNVVTGIIKDPQHELLPGVLVTVRDREGVPLRALKTNKLGQFAASTPLPNGVYIVEVEDPRNRFIFDRAQITAAGAIIPTIEITAKNDKELAREKLAKEIFGNQL